MLEKETSAPLGVFDIITSLGVGGLIKSVLYPLMGIPLFGIMGYVTFLNGPGATESETGMFMRIVFAILLIPSYAAAGGIGGFVLAITGTILSHADELESLLNRMVNPMMAMLVKRLSPDKGIPVDSYLQQLDDRITRLRGEKETGLRGPSHWLYGVILRIFRRFAAQRLLQNLQKRGESLVTNISLERFIREGLVSYLREEIEDQLYMIRYGILALLGVMSAFPLYLWLL